MRDFKISRKEGEWYNTEVTDSYGNEYQSYFETAYEANEWIYYVNELIAIKRDNEINIVLLTKNEEE